jgi:hypothetical protein
MRGLRGLGIRRAGLGRIRPDRFGAHRADSSRPFVSAISSDGKPCARVTSTGGWMDLAARKLVTPPDALLALFKKDIATDDFVELPSSLKA